MECNREEAIHAREKAEQAFAKQDFGNAKKLLAIAQKLYPSLEGLSQMMCVVDVHAVAQIKLGGNETDWYGILQVDPSADESVVKKQYRKLALLLHPDKNKAVGAEAAFKLIGEAWGILSDKGKRSVHDMRRVAKPKPAPTVRVAAASTAQTFQTVHQPSAAPPAPAPNPSQSNSTFWTSCPACKMQYQYMRTYENYQLQCPKCKEVFTAKDIHGAKPANGPGSTFNWAAFNEAPRPDANFNTAGGAFNGTSANGFMNSGQGTFSSTFGNQSADPGFFSSAAATAAAASKVAAATKAAAAAVAAATATVTANNSAADVVQQTFQKVKRERVEAAKESKRKEKERRMKEREELKIEKEMQRKIREREGLDRLVAKKKEQIAREESKRKADVKIGRKLKRKRRSGSDGEEEEEDLEDEDSKLEDDDLSSPPLPRRRSSRNKKAVPTYKVDASDSDIEEFTPAKRVRSDDSGRDESLVDKSEEYEGEDVKESGRSNLHAENGTRGKSIAENSNYEKRDGGMNGDEHVSEWLKAKSRFERMREEPKRASNAGDSHKTHLKKSVPEAVILSDEEKSPQQSHRILRGNRRRSFTEEVPKKDLASPEHRLSSTGSQSSSAKDDEEDMESEEQIAVPDPDFHDFDSLRTEKDIYPGQVWAIYDNQDGMPRFYGRVSRVSHSPFKVYMYWLELVPSTIQQKWADGSALSITCGEFKTGKSFIEEHINIFSHVVVQRAAKGLVKIFPKKDQVWAIYKDWDPEQSVWPETIPRSHGQGTTYSYDMVEALSDFSEEIGVKTVRLVKLGGFKTLFHRDDGQSAVRYFKPSEMLKFSHSIPHERMDQIEGVELPNGTLELDPASTPLDLIL